MHARLVRSIGVGVGHSPSSIAAVTFRSRERISRAAIARHRLAIGGRVSYGSLGQQTRSFVARATEYLPLYADYTDSQSTVRESISKICSQFPESYWADVDQHSRWPSEFQKAIARDGWLGIMMPTEYGGSELGLSEATVMMQTIAESGGGYTASSSVHMNIFGLAPVVKYGSDEQKARFLPPLTQGRERACFAVTEANTGLDTLKLQSRAVRNGDIFAACITINRVLSS